jgi:Holliday junction resolvase RusA-like endonuclease
MIYECSLPFPPSANHLHKNGRTKKGTPVRHNSKQYTQWLKKAPLLVPPTDYGSIDFPVHIKYKLYFPTKHKQRDVDNYIKAPQDYLVNQGVLFEDNRTIVQSIYAEYAGSDRDNARVEIKIFKIENNVVAL